MEQFYILNGLEAKIEMESVLKAIDCIPDSPVYEEYVEEYQDIYQECMSLVKPVGILGFGQLTERTATEEYGAGTRVIYAITTVGNKLSQCSTQAFQEGDYVRGMLCDAMADNALFSLERGMIERLREVCAEHNVGVLKRLEAPHDIPMEIQREAWEQLQLKERLGIDISCGYMFHPVKTSCQIFVLTDDTKVFQAQHDCRKCSNVNCKFRNIPVVEVIVQKGDKIKSIFLEEGQSLMDGLLKEGYYISAVCGGRGRCGKCKVKVLEGAAPVTSEDEKMFSEKELAEGWRLSCMLYPNRNDKDALGEASTSVKT